MLTKKIFYILSIFLILGVTMSAVNVRAHAPVTIDMEYDVNKQELSVKIIHGVTDPTYHYVSQIDVWVNVTQRWEYHHEIFYDNQDNHADPLVPLEEPTYTFTYTEQPIHSNITTSHTLADYILPFPAQLTGERLDEPINQDTGEPVGFIGKGRTNITLSVHCSLGGTLTEHYYVGLPYYNPHLTFSVAVIPTIVSSIIVFGLLFTLPLLGQKNAPKLQEKVKEGRID
jgi:hypothetical protein